MALKCECGGKLQSKQLKEFDLSPFAGFAVTLRDITGYQCEECKAYTLSGNTINMALNLIAFEITQLPFRLNSDLAKYLRKRLGVTQSVLAERLSIDRTTVADWERGATIISPQYDYILRGLLINMFTDLKMLPKHAAFRLSSVRRAPPQALPCSVIEKVIGELKSGRAQNMVNSPNLRLASIAH